MNKKTGRSQRGVEQKLLMIAAMLQPNRPHESAAQIFRERDHLGRFSGAGTAQGRRPSLDDIARRIAVEQGVSPTSVWHWYSLYKRFGYTALSRRRRSDRGKAVLLDRHPELLPILDVRLSLGMSPMAVWKSLRWVRGIHSVSYDVVLRYARCQYRTDGESPARAGSATL
jgi:hypothetical protein